MSSFPVPVLEGSAKVAFSYASLPQAQAEIVQRMAHQVRAYGDQIRKQTESGVIEIGRALIAVKAILETGQFGRWLEAEFGWTDRTARNLMSAARLADERSEIVSVLPPTALYKLASVSTPETCVTEVIQRIEAGETLSAKAIGRLVKDARKRDVAERQAQRKLQRKLQGRSPEEQAKVRRAEERRRQVIARDIDRDRQLITQREQASRDAVAFLRQHLGGEFEQFATLFEAGSPYGFAEVLKAARANDGGDA